MELSCFKLNKTMCLVNTLCVLISANMLNSKEDYVS